MLPLHACQHVNPRNYTIWLRLTILKAPSGLMWVPRCSVFGPPSDTDRPVCHLPGTRSNITTVNPSALCRSATRNRVSFRAQRMGYPSISALALFFSLLLPLPRFSSASTTLHPCPHGVHAADICLVSCNRPPVSLALAR